MAFKGRSISGGIGKSLGGVAPRLPRLSGLGSTSQGGVKSPSLTAVTGNKGLAHFGRDGITAQVLSQGHKKIGGGL